MQHSNIYDLITREVSNYKLPVPIAEHWEWNMYEHIREAVLYKNSIYKDGYDPNKPFKNIVRPILNLQYRAEGFDVKDIVFYINDQYKYFKSFLVKKFHEVWARKNQIDTFIDKLVETYVDFGGVLVKDVGEIKPEVVPWPRIAFADQTDILAGPICEKHYYSSDQLKEMEKKGWENIDDVIVLSRKENDTKTQDERTKKKSKTPGKYIEVYEVHGVFPRYWLNEQDETGNYYYQEDSDEMEYIRQVHIITFYQAEDKTMKGITLFKGEERELPYKLLLRDEIFGRALGLGGVEELFQAQVWINYDEIHKKNMLDAASKVIFQTADPAFANRNKIQNMENLEIVVTEPNMPIQQIPNVPGNLPLFENSTKEWEQHARQMGAATESILGESPSAGTPFKLQELVTAEAHSLHEYRKGKIAVFLDEVYQDWIIPRIAKEITKEQEFIAELDLEELQYVADNLVTCEKNHMVKEMILNGEVITPEVVELHGEMVREQFMKGGNKKFIQILEGEMKDAPLAVKLNIAGKQKNLSGVVDKLVNVFRTIVANPAVLQSPPMAKLFNQIIESSGLSPIDFYGFTVPAPQQAQVSNEATKPLEGVVERPALANQVSNV